MICLENLTTLLFRYRIIISYAIMPETENRTLEEIEAHFSDKTKKWTDTNVQKIQTITAEGVSA